MALPLAVLGIRSTPLSGRSSSSSVSPLVGLSVPATSLGGSEASRSGLPVGASSASEGTGLDSGGANLLSTRQLLLLDLLFSLGLRIAVCDSFVSS